MAAAAAIPKSAIRNAITRLLHHQRGSAIRKAITRLLHHQRGRPTRKAQERFLTAHSLSLMTLLLHFDDKSASPRISRPRHQSGRPAFPNQTLCCKKQQCNNGTETPKITHSVRNAPKASLALSVWSRIFG